VDDNCRHRDGEREDYVAEHLEQVERQGGIRGEGELVVRAQRPATGDRTACADRRLH
jgi:hypothetical protein